MVRRPRQLILYRHVHPTVIGIGRVLHDSMEAQRHLLGAYGDD
jgi:toxin ParE1/3/4